MLILAINDKDVVDAPVSDRYTVSCEADIWAHPCCIDSLPIFWHPGLVVVGLVLVSADCADDSLLLDQEDIAIGVFYFE